MSKVMGRKTHARHALTRAIPAVAAACLATLLLPTAAAAGGDQSRWSADTRIAPTWSSQTHDWTPAQHSVYRAKFGQYQAIAHRTRPRDPIVTLDMGPWGLQAEYPQWNCGPATISMMYSHYGINIPQSQAAADMGTNSTSGTYRGAMQTEANKYQTRNGYVWQNVGPNGGGGITDSGPDDLYSLTATDIYGNWGAPAYNGRTWNPSAWGYPLWHYQSQDFYHYFPASAYDDGGSMIWVNDPWWPSTDGYDYHDIWKFTDNFWGVPNQVLW